MLLYLGGVNVWHKPKYGTYSTFLPEGEFGTIFFYRGVWSNRYDANGRYIEYWFDSNPPTINNINMLDGLESLSVNYRLKNKYPQGVFIWRCSSIW